MLHNKGDPDFLKKDVKDDNCSNVSQRKRVLLLLTVVTSGNASKYLKETSTLVSGAPAEDLDDEEMDLRKELSFLSKVNTRRPVTVVGVTTL